MFISKQISTDIKGWLILLIVIGHNHILAPDGSMLKEFLYQFHVICFFILPFFYQSNSQINWNKIGDLVVRNWMPYTWICVCCYIAYSLYIHSWNMGWKHIQAYITGSESLLSTEFGFVFPWFLPAYCSFSILYGWAKKRKLVYITLVILSIFSYLLTWEQYYVCRNSIPFGISQAIHYWFLGVVTFYLCKISKYTKYIGSLFFIFLSVGYWNKMTFAYAYLFFPVTAFMLLLVLALFVKSRWFTWFGEYSLGIYLIHLFISNALEIIFHDHLFVGVIDLCITMGASLGVAMLIQKNRKWQALLLPRTFKGFKNFYNIK